MPALAGPSAQPGPAGPLEAYTGLLGGSRQLLGRTWTRSKGRTGGRGARGTLAAGQQRGRRRAAAPPKCIERRVRCARVQPPAAACPPPTVRLPMQRAGGLYVMPQALESSAVQPRHATPCTLMLSAGGWRQGGRGHPSRGRAASLSSHVPLADPPPVSSQCLLVTFYHKMIKRRAACMVQKLREARPPASGARASPNRCRRPPSLGRGALTTRGSGAWLTRQRW